MLKTEARGMSVMLQRQAGDCRMLKVTNETVGRRYAALQHRRERTRTDLPRQLSQWCTYVLLAPTF